MLKKKAFPPIRGLYYLFTLIALLFWCSATAFSQTVWYVNANSGNDGNSGASWNQAFATLTKALSSASSGNEIWVAGGTYYPGPGTNVTETFSLKTGVSVYGGFQGSETSRSQRSNWQSHPSILEGSKKSYHVVSGANLSNSTILDGFIISGGNAVGSTTVGGNVNHGGGIYLTGTAPVLRNLIIRNNRSNFYGAGLSNTGANLVLEDVTFISNTSFYNTSALGGAMYNSGAGARLTRVSFQANVTAGNGGGLYNTGANLSLDEVEFTGNKAVNGGGLWNSAVATMSKLSFTRDTATTAGGGMYVGTNAQQFTDASFSENIATNGAGAYLLSGTMVFNRASFIANVSSRHGGGVYSGGSVDFHNSIFSRNQVTTASTTGYGGGIYHTSGTANFRNVTFSSNQTAYVHATTVTGAGLYRNGGTVNVYNSILWGNRRGNNVADQLSTTLTAISNTIVEGGYTGNSLNRNPQFENAANDDLRLKAGSPAIDAGDQTFLTFQDFDLSGNNRVVNQSVDLGAYESAASGAFVINEQLPTVLSRGNRYELQLTTTGGSGGQTWSIVDGELPAGMSLSAAGRLTGSPLLSGDYSFVVKVNSGAQTTERWYSGTIAAGPARIYVNANSTGSDRGGRWADAFTSLQSALALAQQNDTIWVAKGVYSPGALSASTFNLISGVRIYGGFAGTESELSQRDESQLHTLNETVLDGQLINNHVVSNTINVTNTTLLDGFTITRGKASGTGATSYGGGIYTTGGSPVFRNLLIKFNEAARGGGVYNTGNAVFEKVVFANNSSTAAYGGGLWNAGTSTLYDVVFRENSASTYGGGIYSTGAALLERVSFIANTSVSHGAGFYTSGGNPKLDNVVFSRNSVSGTSTSSYGAGFYNGSGTATISNATFSNNTLAYTSAATTSVGAGLSGAGTNNIYNSIFWGNKRGNDVADQVGPVTSTLIYNSIVQDGYSVGASSSIYLGDPLFINAAADDLRLSGGSLAIDAGDNSRTTTSTDIAGNPRVVGLVDLGAYEASANDGLKIQTSDFASFVRGTAVDQNLTASGGNGNYTWSVGAGALPAGLVLSSSGQLSGIPIVTGTYDVVFSVTDGTKVGNRQYRFTVSQAAARMYVNHAATGDNQGSSWLHAFVTLQQALSLAQDGDEIWVAKGTYSPGPDKTSTFNLISGVKIYGGFSGSEGSLSERLAENISTSNETILHGNNNNYHVVTASGLISNATLLDGFTITGGKTLLGSTGANYYGAGIYNTASTVAAVFKNLVIKENAASNGGGIYNLGPAQFINIKLLNNTASGEGAGIFNSGAATFENMEFNANQASSHGAGMYNGAAITMSKARFSDNTSGNGGGGIFNSSTSTFSELTFTNNKALNGGGIYNNTGNSTFDKLSFEDNSATSSGGAMYVAGGPIINEARYDRNSAGTTGGAIFTNGTASFKRSHYISNTAVQNGGALYIRGTTRLENSLLAANQVTGAGSTGGAIYHYAGTSTLVNLTVVNNTTTATTASGAGLFYRTSGSAYVYNSIFWGNTRADGVSDQLNTGITVSNSIVEDGYAAGNSILIGNPIFVNPAAKDFHLSNGSPAINSGDNAQNASVTDLDNEIRVFEGQIDLGAYEYQGGGESVKIAQIMLGPLSRGAAVNEQFSATGGTGNYTWSLNSGILPQGLRITPQGQLLGNPVVSGNFTFVVSATDGTLNGSRQFTVTVSPGPARLYVNQQASGTNSGGDWENALRDLLDAASISESGDEIWVAKGSYSPGNLVTSSFSLKDGVKWYGGFAGTETSLAERDTSKLRTTNETVLTGGGKSYHVVYNKVALSDATLLDGFTISGGKTLTGSSAENYIGGGIYNSLGTISAVFRNLLVKDNTASYGGGIYDISRSAYINVLVKNNTASGDGGGMHNTGVSTFSHVDFENNVAVGNGGGLWSTGAAELSEVRFQSNRAANGGGMYNSSGVSLLNRVQFISNTASTAGGGMYAASAPQWTDVQFIGNSAGTTGGGLHNTGSGTLDRVAFIANTSVQHGAGIWNSSSPKLENMVFSRNRVTGNNTSGYGAGYYHYAGTVSITNATFSNNSIAYVNSSSTQYGAALGKRTATLNVNNSIFWGNTRGNNVPDQIAAAVVVSTSIVEGGYETGTGIMIGNPMFEDAAADNLRLKSGSIAINAGDNSKSSKAFDIDGNDRIVDDQIDLGAYENQGGSGLSLQPKTLNAQARGSEVAIQMEALGGTGTLTWAIQSGTLPAGLNLSNSGLISGRPVSTGTYTFVITVTDGTLVGNKQYSLQITSGNARLYVSAAASGLNDGSSWSNAFTSLQTALSQAAAGDEIWVARGNYSPGSSTGSSFVLKEGVKWYGGFAGTESTLAERDPAKIRTDNETVLTGGNINYHVIMNTSALTQATVLDGFTISNGKTGTGSTGANYYGGGFYNSTGNPTLSNLLFRDNSGYYGGAFYNGGSPVLKNIIFRSNAAGYYGGAMYNSGSPSLSDVSFENNTANSSGGALYNTGAPTIERARFYSNTSTASGGAVYHSGGTLLISNSAFYANRVSSTSNYAGAGVYHNSGSTTLNNVSLSNNTTAYVNANAQSYGAALFYKAGTLTVNNSILWGNKRGNSVADQVNAGALIAYSIVEGGYAAGSNIFIGDPLFEDSDTGDLRVKAGSAAIDAGDNGRVSSNQDLAGKERIVNDVVDLGALENAGGGSIAVRPLSIPVMQRGEPANVPLSGTGGDDTQYVWSLQSGTLPTGVTLTPNGLLSNAPMVPGNYTFVVAVTDGTIRGSRQYTVQVNPGAARLYVDDTASGTNSGSSWQNALTDLQTAIGQSSEGDEIWVAKGTYSPGAKANSYFVPKEGLKLYGGFAGTESTLAERDTSKIRTENETILSGSEGAASYHVIYNTAALSNATIIDGFTISGGRTATGSTGSSYYGGGIYNTAGQIQFKNLLIKSNAAYYYGGGMYNQGAVSLENVIFRENTSSYLGGGLYNSGTANLSKVSFISNNSTQHGGGLFNSGQSIFNQIHFNGNKAGGSGGGMYNTAALTLNDFSFASNSATVHGGGLWTSAAVTVNRSVFQANSATQSGGGVYNTGASAFDRVSFFGNTSVLNGGGLYNSGTSVVVSNSVFSRNSVSSTASNFGGGVFTVTGSITLINNTFSNNQIAYKNTGTAFYGGGLYLKSGTANAYNTIFWGNKRGNGVLDQLNDGVNVINGLVQNGYPNGVNIFIGNPEFEDAAQDDLRLKPGSAAIDNGDNSKNASPADRDGNIRIVNDQIDLGAYENSGLGSLMIQPSTLPSLLRGSLLNQQFTISEPGGTLVWNHQSGTLPPGLNLTSSGLLTGTPTQTGEYTFVLAVDNGTSKGTKQFKVQVTAGAARLYVWASATGANSGSDWANAYTDLQTAVLSAEAGDEIWVAKGTYSPGLKNTSYFTLKEGVKWYGGFSGTETGLAQRDSSKIRTDNETILDGSQGVASYHVLYNNAPLTDATIIDGFTVRGGQTIVNGTNYAQGNYAGAGLYNINENNRLVLRNMVFKDNRASNGAAIFTSGQPTFENLLLQANVADFRGGGIYLSGSAKISNSRIVGNTAQSGAGVYTDGSPEISTTEISTNNASVSGGGIYATGSSVIISESSISGNAATQNGGGMYIQSGNHKLTDISFKENTAGRSAAALYINAGTSRLDRTRFILNTAVASGGAFYNGSATVEITNSIFSRNKVSSTAANYGGAIYNYSGTLSLSNISFSNNGINYRNTSTTSRYGGAIYRHAGTVNLYNSILWGNTRGNDVADQLGGTINTGIAIIQGADGTNPELIDADPWFADAANDDLSLLAGSVGIDLGDASKNATVKDIEGKERVVNDVIDLGAYENTAGNGLTIEPETLPALKRGVFVTLPLDAGQTQGTETWGIATGTIPPGLVITSDGNITGIPVVPGLYHFIVKVSDASMRGTRRYSVEVLEGPARLYVSASASGLANGSSWANAFTDLQLAIAQANSGDEIWVAKGTYSPGTKVTSSFVLKDGVKWYGGFAGTEASLAERDASLISTTNETILDGSQGIASYHVVLNTSQALSAQTIVDGFTISGGRSLINGTNYTSPNYMGGGIYDGAATSSAIYRNLTLKDNRASTAGAIYSAGSSVFENIVVSGNTAVYIGGGIYSTGASTFTDIILKGNSAQNGGGWYNAGIAKFHRGRVEGNTANISGAGILTNSSSLEMDSVVFLNNAATQHGGAVYVNKGTVTLRDLHIESNRAGYSGGGIYIVSGVSSVFDRLKFIANTSVQHGAALYNSLASFTMSNSMFSRNSVSSTAAYYGGAFYSNSGSVLLNNNTFSDNSIRYSNANTTISYGAALFRRSGTVTLNNSIVWGNTRGGGVSDQLNAGISASNSLIQGGYATGNLIVDQNPEFTNAGDDDLSLSACSPGINLGNNALNLSSADLSQNNRVAGGVIDLGAYEFQGDRLVLAPASLPQGNRGTFYSQQLSASGGNGNYTYKLSYGKLPDGLLLSPSGLISGNPIVNGNFVFNITVSDGTTCGNLLYQVDVVPGTGVVRIFVNAGATSGMNNGSNWEHAYLDLQNALEVSMAGDEIWVAKGNYSPGNLATSKFSLKPDVKIYGGFAAVETSLAERDTSLLRTVNESVLDGSKGVASYHVVYNNIALTSTTVLNGFTISGGRALTSSSSGSNYYGAGFYNSVGAPHLENIVFRDNNAYRGAALYTGGAVVLKNVVFENNSATNSGAAIYTVGTAASIVVNQGRFINNTSAAHGGALMLSAGSPVLTDVYFKGNKVSTSHFGGAIYSNSELTLTRAEFINNSAYYGGAIYAINKPVLTDVVFKNNQAASLGGALYLSGTPTIDRASFIANTSLSHGGAIYESGNLTLSNAVFSRNNVTATTSNYGGAIYHVSGVLKVTNTSFSQNRIAHVNAGVASLGGAIYRRAGTVEINNSILWKNTRGNNVPDQINAGALLSNVIVQDGYPVGSIVLSVDPQFADADNDDLRLQSCSPAINIGDNSKVGSGSTDLDGNNRVSDNTVDLGAYENLSARISISTTLPKGTRGQSFNQQLVAEGGSGTYTWSINIGKLPDGLSLTPSGLITGRPIADGTYTFNVAVSDGTMCGNRLYQMEILPGSGTVKMYVNQAATSGMNNGSDWANAFLDLQTAFGFAQAGDSIWVAKGSYSPGSLSGSRFALVEGAKVFGGFNGTELAFADRDTLKLHTDNETILSGSSGAASYHIVFNNAALTANTVLDGFTISGAVTASSSSTTSANYVGGGIYNAHLNANPVLRNLVIRNNKAVNGGGMYNTGSPQLYKVIFEDNVATTASGGAMYNTGNPVFHEVEFRGNTAAQFGGGLYSTKGTLEMTGVNFTSNVAARNGGGMYATGTLNLSESIFRQNQANGSGMGGGLFVTSGSILNIRNTSFIANESGYHGGGLYNMATAKLHNVVFSRNRVKYNGSVYGGGMFSTGAQATLTNVTFSGNSIAYSNSSKTASYGGALYRNSGDVTVTNSIFWNNKRGAGVADQMNANIIVSKSLVEGDYKAGTTIIAADPQFRDAANDDLSLLACSPAINMGDNAAATAITVDIAGNPRIVQNAIDLGAYEFQGTSLANTELVLDNADQWRAYSTKISAVEGQTFTYTLVYGTLPDGLVLAADGTLSGTPIAAGEFTFGLSVQGADVCGTLNVKMTVNERQPYILEVYPPLPLPLDVKLGTEFANIPLPTQVQVLLSDQSTTKLPVSWLAGNYDGNVIAKYKITGLLTLTDPDMNPDSLTASINLSVFEPVTKYIVAVDSLPGMDVLAGTPFNLLPLPAQVRVTYDDGSTENLNISWKQGSYQEKAGLYRIFGDLVLTDPDSNPADFDVFVDVQALKNIISVETFDDKEVTLNTTVAALALPVAARVTYHDQTTENLLVQWDVSEYLANTAGVYPLPGTLVLKPGIGNSNGIQASITIIIPKDIATIPESAPISVPYETAFADVPFPQKVRATFNDGSEGDVSVDWTEGEYRDDLEGTYTVYGEILSEPGITNSLNLKASIKVTVLERPKNIIAVAPVDSLSVPFGTSFSDLLTILPGGLRVTYHDLSEETLTVHWNEGDYNSQESASYSLKGDLVLPQNVVNKDSLVAKAVVFVELKFITAVHPSDTLFVPYGTAFSDLGLPETVEVDYNDGFSGAEEVQWSADGFDPMLEGTYKLKGTLHPGALVENKNNLEAEIHVVVLRRPPLVVSIVQPDTLRVPFGTQFDAVLPQLPAAVNVLLDDATTVSVPATWEADNYSGYTYGVYTLPGTLVLPDNISNPNDVEPSMVVQVGKQYIISVSPLDTISVAYATASGSVPVPAEVEAAYNDLSSGNLGVNWDFTDYQPNVPGLYTLSGSLVVPDDIDNPDSLKAAITVRVEMRRYTLVQLAKDTLEVEFGTAFPALALPATLSGTLDDASQIAIGTMGWDQGTYNPMLPGEYELKGKLVLPELVDNPDSLEAVVRVIVGQKYIIQVDTIAAIEVPFGTTFEQLSLPGSIAVVYNDQSPGQAMLSWQPGTYNGLAAGEYTLVADLIPDGDASNKDNLQASVKVRVLNKLRVLTEITPDSITVEYGTPFTSVPLPAQKEGLFDDGSRSDLTLTWSSGDYDENIAGVYRVTGKPTIPADAENPDEVQAVAMITVGKKYIRSIVQPDSVSVAYGTPYAEVPTPAELRVTYNDGSQGLLSVVWEAGNYRDTTGVYSLPGILLIDDEIDNPDSLEAQLIVTVGEFTPDLESVTDPASIEVPYGTSLNDVLALLPEKVGVRYNNNTEAELQVQWSTEDYNGMLAGTYDFTGVLQLLPGATNLRELAANVKVMVGKKTVVSVDHSGSVQGIYGEELSGLNLPEKVSVHFNDGSTDELAVIWDETGYDAQALTEQHLTGLIVLTDDILNPDSLKGNITITLLKEIVAVDSIASRTVVYGTPYEQLALPSLIRVTYNDSTTADLALTWDSTLYTAANAGTLIMESDLPVPAGVVNTNNLTAKVEIIIQRAELTITAEHKIRYTGEVNPELTYVWDGFVKGENEGILEALPAISTTAVADSEAGQYPINIQVGPAINYNITINNGVLHVVNPRPAPLPLSGPLSVLQIADYMLALGELNSAERDAPFSIAFQNENSHLEDKDAPYSVSDWYGYGPVITLPALVTGLVQNISSSAVAVSSYIHNDGGSAVTDRGFCWSTSSEPSIADNKLSVGSGVGSFNTNLSGLQAGTTYYIRAFATNAEGTAYGNEYTFTTKP